MHSLSCWGCVGLAKGLWSEWDGLCPAGVNYTVYTYMLRNLGVSSCSASGPDHQRFMAANALLSQ